MDYKKLTVAAFILTCLAQLFVPAKMIFDQEDILKTGTEYKFRTAPIDPNDPFRGKYIILNYMDTEFKVDDASEWGHNETVFVELTNNAEGYAIIKNVFMEAPKNTDYVEAYISYVNEANDEATLAVEYPFDRFYMDEFKAPVAEETYMEANLGQGGGSIFIGVSKKRQGCFKGCDNWRGVHTGNSKR